MPPMNQKRPQKVEFQLENRADITLLSDVNADEEAERLADASAFKRAIEEYSQSRREKSSTPQFLTALQSSTTKDDVHRAIVELEQVNTSKASTRHIRNILNPIIKVLTDYTGIVNTLGMSSTAQADPMPTCIIWGCLQVVVQASERFINLYDEIKDQLNNIEHHLDRLTGWEKLFGEHAALQKVLVRSYVNVIRFWRRVEKECKRCVPNRMVRSLASFSTSKLARIVANIKDDADEVDKQAAIIQAASLKTEREKQAEERELADSARGQQNAIYQLQLKEAAAREQDRKRDELKSFRNWLIEGSLLLIESNYRQQEQNISRCHRDTCAWLPREKAIQCWLKPREDRRKIWLRAMPGAGKSVLCSSMIRHTESHVPDSSCIFHYFSSEYFSFEENTLSEIQIYRCLVEQLVKKLQRRLQDLPEDVHQFTQCTTTVANSEDLKALFGMLVGKLPVVYIFLDGLDEVCDDGPCWAQLSKILDFLLGLMRTHDNVRIWCSSQDRSCIRTKAKDFDIIDINHHFNGQDIERFLSCSILELDAFDDVDQGTRNLVLRDLCDKADGCFLWASLMLDSITKAPTLNAIQHLILDSMPKDYDKYYQKKMDSIAFPQRQFVSCLLSCMVYAKRPLCIDALCEAVAISHTCNGDNMDETQIPYKNKILKLCEPLVQIQEASDQSGGLATCHFCHASVRAFLLKNSSLYSGKADTTGYDISGQTIANICLSYLSQPRYMRLLTRNGDSFHDVDGGDIMDHALLVYAAKYWDKHLDEVIPSQVTLGVVENFLRSRQFQTCLQVQSLLVEGIFQVWYSEGRLTKGPHYRRAFPRWLQEYYGTRFGSDYRFFVHEWGKLLNLTTSRVGLFPGELDRVFWNALGAPNFLRSGKSRYRSFAILDEDTERTSPKAVRYFDSINEDAAHMVVVTLREGPGGSPQLQLCCQRWSLSGRTPRLMCSQALEVGGSSWRLYDRPATSTLSQPNGRPLPISSTPDLRCIRVGSKVFCQFEGETYSPARLHSEMEIYFEEISHQDSYVALSSRQAVIEEESEDKKEALSVNNSDLYDFSRDLSEVLEEIEKSISEAESSKATTHYDETQTSTSSRSSSRTSILSTSIGDREEVSIDKREQLPGTDSDSDILSQESQDEDDNSAETSYSEASTAEYSGEEEDENLWNDWEDDVFAVNGQEVSSDVSLDFEENADDPGSSADINFKEIDDLQSEGSIEIGEDDGNLTSLLDQLAKRVGNSPSSSSARSIESHYSPSFAPSSDNPDDDMDDDIFANEAGRQIEDLLLGRQSQDKSSTRTSKPTLRVFDTNKGEEKLIFHFSKTIEGAIFASPPAFHPCKPLLVWPIGSQEILFANIANNTYFTRQLSCSHTRSCHIFVKAQFSKDGKYLHFAALEARQIEECPVTGEGAQAKGCLDLHLQVSTHRLSSRKTERCPPRLCFRTTVALGKRVKLHVANPPYTLTWTATELYVASGEETLSVIKIPLFYHTSPNTQKERTYNPICYSQGTVYLPRMDLSRRVQYFPPPKPQEPTDSGTFPSARPRRSKHRTSSKARLVISSHCSIPAQRHFVHHSLMSPPIVVYLDEDKDLGPWTCKPPSTDKLAGRTKADRINPLAGRLRSRFENFDRNEDCDIVPFLA